jgi:hypothetical protein
MRTAPTPFRSLTRQPGRALLATVGPALSVCLAGCGGGGGSTADDGGSDADSADSGGIYGGSSGGDTTTSGGSGSGDVPEAVDSYLQGANGYDGTIVDATGEDAVTVTVGGGASPSTPLRCGSARARR